MVFAMHANGQGMKLMLDLGANPGAVDTIGRTALHYLVQADQTGEVTEWLLTGGGDDFDLNARSRGQET